MTRITFLGTGGGRFATFMQTRRTAGFMVNSDVQLHVDPGPGALRAAWRFGADPLSTDAVFVSHTHTEHYGDAEVIVEAMTRGGWEPRGTLIAAVSTLRGSGGIGPAISSYHQGMVDDVVHMSPGDTRTLGDLELKALPTHHTDPTGVGLRIGTPKGVISYTADTTVEDDIKEAHRGARVLILNLTIRRDISGIKHLTPESAAELIDAVKPEIVFLTHLGQRILEHGPEHYAEDLEKRTAVQVVAAEDGMIVTLGDDIEIAHTEE